MQEIKIFRGSEIDKVEKQINAWLRNQSTITVVQMLQSISDARSGNELAESWTITISILYKWG